MKSCISYLFLPVILLSGCYYTTIDKNKTKAPVQEAPVVQEPLIPPADFDRFYQASDAFYESVLKKSRFSGGFLVAKKGEIIYEKYTGLCRTGSSDSLCANSSLHLASVSKTFTGMAVLKLWEEGKLNLNDEASVYLPGFNYPGVTVKTLLNHRSGLPNYTHVMEQMGWDRNTIMYNQDILQFLIGRKNELSVGSPDRSFSYCNTNYALLALIIENVSGLPYPQFMHDHFFAPLDMADTYVFTMADSARALPSYNWKNQQEAFTYLDAVYGDKNIYSTPRDLLKWESALSYGQLFKPETLEAAYSGYSYEKKGVNNYGLGWRMLEYTDKEKVIFHNGWWHGNNTVFARMIKDSATVIVLGNRFNKNIYQARKLYAAFGDYATDENAEE